MSPLAFLAVLATLAVVAQGSTKDDTHYVAAVVDYFPSIVHSDRDQNMMDNIAALEGFMAEAKKQDVDILVFPEEGLRGLRGLPFHMYIPAAEDQATPCTSPSAFPEAKPLVQLSCLALKYQMYLVVNLNEKAPCLPSQAAACPNRGFFHHNTDVAFDRTGKVVARYRKYNLFGEYGNEPSPAPEYSTFETDFGVRFGMFICFDILFDTPAARLARDMNITDFVFSAAWFSEVPFLTAVQAHSGWAHALDVNLLAAAYNDPTRGATGSGIYRGRHGVLASIMNWRQESTMLVHRVPKASQWDDDEVQPQMDRINPVLNYGSGTDPFDDMQNLTMIQDHLSVYTTELLDRPEAGTRASKRVDLCSNGLCCRFDVTWQGSDTYTLSSGAAGLHAGFSLARDFNKTEAELEFDGLYYRLVAFSGVRDHSGVATTGVQVCALVSCLNKELASCGWTAPRLDTGNIKWSEFLSVSIEADYEKDGTLQFASTQAGPRYDPLPASTYALQSSPVVVRAGEVPKQTVRLDLKQPLFDLRTFAIYGRYFAWDGKTPTTR